MNAWEWIQFAFSGRLHDVLSQPCSVISVLTQLCEKTVWRIKCVTPPILPPLYRSPVSDTILPLLLRAIHLVKTSQSCSRVHRFENFMMTSSRQLSAESQFSFPCTSISNTFNISVFAALLFPICNEGGTTSDTLSLSTPGDTKHTALRSDIYSLWRITCFYCQISANDYTVHVQRWEGDYQAPHSHTKSECLSSLWEFLFLRMNLESSRFGDVLVPPGRALSWKSHPKQTVNNSLPKVSFHSDMTLVTWQTSRTVLTTSVCFSIGWSCISFKAQELLKLLSNSNSNFLSAWFWWWRYTFIERITKFWAMLFSFK